MRALDLPFDQAAAEAETRNFYASLGLSPKAIEAAILLLRQQREARGVITSPIKGKRRKGSKGNSISNKPGKQARL